MTLLDAYNLAWRAGVDVGPRDKWLDLYRNNDHEIWPIAKGGRFIGFFLIHQVDQGQVMAHIVVLPEWHGRWVTKQMVNAYRLWKPRCPIYAPIACDNKAAMDLARRMGWKFYRAASGYFIYVKEPHNES